MRKSEAGKVAVLLAVALVVLVGWEGRGALVSKTSRRAPYHPATLAEAHRFLAKHSVDPQLLVENRPFKNYSPKSVPDLNLGSPILDLPDNSRRPRGSFSTDQSFAPMPAPLDGQIGATLPNPSPLSIHKENSPVADLHGLEAKLRTCISAHGGRVIRVGESDGGESKSFYVSVATDEARSLMASVERNMGGRVSVSGPSEDDSSNEGIDSVKASEIKAAENSVASLKKQLDQDEISFLPEAPVLKSLRAQYAEARSQLSSLRRTAHPNSLIRVTLASG